MKILHIITGLGNGGAENTLYKVCKHDLKNEHTVISISTGGKYHSILKKMGIKVYSINFRFYSIFKLLILISLIRSLKPDILQTWLIIGDLLGGIAGRLAGVKNIVWNIHFSNLKIGSTSLRNIIIIKILAKLSYLIPKSIVVVSKDGIKNCKNLGYCKKKLIFIPNGYELDIFNYSKRQELFFKKKLKIKKDIPIIGSVSRYDPIKDHITLLNALSLVRLKNIEFICILIGLNINKKNKALTNQIKLLNLKKNIKLLGNKKNIAEVMNGLDIHILSSKSEAFPNVVVEAMACKTPCIATNVGDCSFIIGKTGWLVSPQDPIKLAKVVEIAFAEIRSKNWNKRRNQARLRIKQNFDISKMVKSLNKLWFQIFNNQSKNEFNIIL